jgi:hypothetical protein
MVSANYVVWLKHNKNLHSCNTIHGTVNTEIEAKEVLKIFLHISVVKIVVTCGNEESSWWGLRGWEYQVILILTNTLQWREISQCLLLHLCSWLHLKISIREREWVGGGGVVCSIVVYMVIASVHYWIHALLHLGAF